jgi:hypothetical protein
MDIRAYLKIDGTSASSHARESGYPENPEKCWIPIYSGMTVRDLMRLERDFEIGSKEGRPRLQMATRSDMASDFL